MKKTIITLAVAAGFLTTAQASITETWNSVDLAAANGTLTVAETATNGGYGNFHITAVLDIEALNTRFAADDWGVIFGFYDASTSNKGYALTMNQTGSNTSGTFYAEKTADGSFSTLDDNAGIYYPDGSNNIMETFLASGNYTSLAMTLGLDGSGYKGWMTVVDTEGNEITTNAGGVIKGAWADSSFGKLGTIIYDTDVVKYITVNNAWDSDAFADNTAAIAAVAVPEPATATLSLLALAGLAARRRRK